MDKQNTTTEQPQQTDTQEVTMPVLFDEPEQPAEQSPQQPEQSQPQTIQATDIILPEGYEYDEELGNSFLGILNDEKLSRKELAQKLFDLYQDQNVKFLDGLKAAEDEKNKKFEADMAQKKADWLKQCEADKEYGGQNWEASQAIIDRGCKQLATPEAVALMQRNNLNTHPEIVRMFYRAGKLSGEDNSQISGNGAGKTTDPAMAISGESLRNYHKRRGEI